MNAKMQWAYSIQKYGTGVYLVSVRPNEGSLWGYASAYPVERSGQPSIVLYKSHSEIQYPVESPVLEAKKRNTPHCMRFTTRVPIRVYTSIPAGFALQ